VPGGGQITGKDTALSLAGFRELRAREAQPAGK
jgi:hypothetical protein